MRKVVEKYSLKRTFVVYWLNDFFPSFSDHLVLTMPLFWRKKGEKTTLLEKCGELLFGCSGELLVTQGIYVPKSLTSSSSHFICKRTVWVPDSLSHECLIQHLESFSATLPFSVQKVASLHRFGLCGINPTRTIHAIDKHFLLLIRFPHNHFSVYGIVGIGQDCPGGVIFIDSISTDSDVVLNSVEWMKKENAQHHLSKQSKNRTSHVVLLDTTRHDEGKSVEIGSEPTVMMQEAQGPIQHVSTETESEPSISTPECTYIPPGTCANPSSPSPKSSVNHDEITNTMFLIPCLPLQMTTDASHAYPFSIWYTVQFLFI